MITGIYEMVKVEDGPSREAMSQQPFEMGMMSFTPDGKVSMSQKIRDQVFTYVGTFEVSGDQLSIVARVCSEAAVAGSTLVRTIEKHAGDELVLSGIGAKTGNQFRISWKKLL